MKLLTEPIHSQRLNARTEERKVTSDKITELLWSNLSNNVVILRWPENADDARQLDHIGVAHLLLVDPDADAPDVTSCVEDWIRLPATDDDVRARIRTLRLRGTRHPTEPTIDVDGRLSYHGRDIFLSPIDHRLVKLLVRNFGELVHENELLAEWPTRGSNDALRVHISRLRKQLEPIGLTITTRRRGGYRMREHEATVRQYEPA
jgi:hypothetical protein